MISTTGRSPVIAAPTPMPVNPGSEIGVSMTRDFPNSSTNPERTLNGVPASATSSPIMHTRGSRRISSASASRTASPSVNSRTATSGIHVLRDLIHAGIGRLICKRTGRVDFYFHFRLDRVEFGLVRDFLRDQRVAEELDRIAVGHPVAFLLLRP